MAEGNGKAVVEAAESDGLVVLTDYDRLKKSMLEAAKEMRCAGEAMRRKADDGDTPDALAGIFTGLSLGILFSAKWLAETISPTVKGRLPAGQIMALLESFLAMVSATTAATISANGAGESAPAEAQKEEEGR